MRAASFAPLLVAFTAPWAVACVPLEGPAGDELEPIGAFSTSAELESTTCGEASDVSFLPTIEQEVKLSRLGRQLVWQVGRTRFVGDLDETERSFVISSQVQIDVTLEPAAEEVEERTPCVVRRIEEIRGTLEEDDRSFEGRIGYRYEAVAGADCAPELAASPPLVAELPCEARYELRGELERAD
jgi:hypothetical protein